MAIERIIDTELHADDEAEKQLETSLRPQNFNEYIGQERLKRNLKLAIEAAKKTGRVTWSCAVIWAAGTR